MICIRVYMFLNILLREIVMVGCFCMSAIKIREVNNKQMVI